VAALTVSYNTRELTAFLLWSLRTIVSWPELEIVVVDNGSRDGSAQLLAESGRGGVCTLLANHGNRHHGPGLNQGISYLASRPGPRPEWIWILDSDVVAARPDALSAAVATAREHSAALAGEPQHDQWHPDGRFGMYSLLMDPAVAWQEQAGPFAGGGDPSLGLLVSAARLGIPMAPFPFTARRPRHPPRARQPRRGPRRRGPLPSLLRVGRGSPHSALRRSSRRGPAIPRPAAGIP